ncbi:MAG: hypothetical protein M3505_13430 [Verrucomicrobiota bacterium]|nr:hypothetical protein [Verrucomicrobiota bacterium]
MRVLDQNMRRRIFFMLEDSTSLEGQWTGIARTDDAEGLAIIDVDGEHLQFRGTARLFNNEEPGVFCEFTTTGKGLTHEFKQIPLAWIPKGQATLLSRAEIKGLHGDFDFPETANLTLSVKDRDLQAEWETDLGRKGSAILKKSAADQPSEIEVEVIRNWMSSKNFRSIRTLGGISIGDSLKPSDCERSSIDRIVKIS